MANVKSRAIIVAVDDSDCALSAAKWACTNFVRPGDSVHVVGVTAPVSAGMAPAMPLSGAGAIAGLHVAYHEAVQQEEKRCHSMVAEAKAAIQHACACPPEQLHAHALPAAGGASGVAESIVTFAKKENADLVVVGSRGMGATKSTLMSVVGLGSVSSYCIHHLTCPVLVARGAHLTAPRKEQRKVVVAVDDSDLSKRALAWAVDMMGPQDELHLISVAFPVPYVAGVEFPMGKPVAPVGDFEAENRGAMEHARSVMLAAVARAHTDLQIATQDAVSARVLEQQEEDEAKTRSTNVAAQTVAAAVEEAAKKVDRSRICYKALEPEGGASGISDSIVHYAEVNDVDLVVVGARGVGAIKRALLGFIGLGSVSEACVHSLPCPVAVVKQ